MDKKEIREIFKENREVEELLKKENERIIRSLIEKYSTEGLELFIRNGFLLKKGGVFITTHKEFFPNGYNQTICLKDDYDNQFYSYKEWNDSIF